MKKLAKDHQFETIMVNITGRVQGVGFRIATVRHAHMLGITGWVRNAPDGSVDALLQGPHDQVDRMLSWLHVGPPASRVAQVESKEENTERQFDRFEQI